MSAVPIFICGVLVGLIVGIFGMMAVASIVLEERREPSK